jgi:ATP-grasp domain-containing protein
MLPPLNAYSLATPENPGSTMSEAQKVTWVLEAEVFPDSHARIRDAVLGESHACATWNDDWLVDGSWPRLAGQAVVFHGSLGNAAAIHSRFSWRPGAFCDVQRFRCSRWYEAARRWLLHREWLVTSVAELAADPTAVLQPLGVTDEIFVRPDSPLKPFSGRVLRREAISLAALDHGFYYDDANLPVIVAPIRQVGQEWCCVIVDGQVVAGSAYAAAGRQALPDEPSGEPWHFAAEIAGGLEAPESVYVLDVCEADGALHLLELNPFSGADLYACDRVAVIRAVSTVAARAASTEDG